MLSQLFWKDTNNLLRMKTNQEMHRLLTMSLDWIQHPLVLFPKRVSCFFLCRHIQFHFLFSYLREWILFIHFNLNKWIISSFSWFQWINSLFWCYVIRLAQSGKQSIFTFNPATTFFSFGSTSASSGGFSFGPNTSQGIKRYKWNLNRSKRILTAKERERESVREDERIKNLFSVCLRFSDLGSSSSSGKICHSD